MRTLDCAIERAVKKADDLTKFGLEQSQLAGWLIELRNYRAERSSHVDPDDSGYFSHLWANWRVSWHCLGDVIQHFLHGLLPFIGWKHQGDKHVISKR